MLLVNVLEIVVLTLVVVVLVLVEEQEEITAGIYEIVENVVKVVLVVK